MAESLAADTISLTRELGSLVLSGIETRAAAIVASMATTLQTEYGWQIPTGLPSGTAFAIRRDRISTAAPSAEYESWLTPSLIAALSGCRLTTVFN
jgi:hypothetical protein